MKEIQETAVNEIIRIFQLQKKNQYQVALSSSAERKKKLSRLNDALLRYRSQIKDALYKDYQKHPSEVDLTEIYPVTGEIKLVKSELHQWMKKKKVATPLAFVGSSSHIQYEPKGVVLIVSPWNFPINLTFGPLIGAIAAGNTVILKPSELTPHISALMKTIIEDLFDEKEVALIEGGVETSKALLKLPFNHIYFTGSTAVGKLVMKAAADNLASVTLELGGKSPTIIDETADIDTAAKRISWAKYFNNGQACLAPDYVFIHKLKKDEFIKNVKKYITNFYSDDAAEEPSYCRIVNNRHYKRVKSYIDDAVDKGAQIEIGGNIQEDQNYVSPTVLTNVSMDAKIMKEEIFGPLLVVHEYTDLKDAINEINSREKPLGLYVYSKNKSNIKTILKNTRAGGSCVNHSTIHFLNHNLPFGGVNNSGIGKGHGKFSFEAFSNARGILIQHVPNALERLMPPYNKAKQKIIDMTIKYF